MASELGAMTTVSMMTRGLVILYSLLHLHARISEAICGGQTDRGWTYFDL